jgi:hypothetical protein
MDGLVKAGAKSEDEFKKAELLIAEAFGVIDSSVSVNNLTVKHKPARVNNHRNIT